jgi:chromosome segregation ATPase
MLGPCGEGAESTLALSIGDPAVKAALAESDDKHTAALNAQRSAFRKATSERDDRIAQLRADQDMISREIASFKEEIEDKKQVLARTEAVGSANIETLTQELKGLQSDSKQLEEERAAVKAQLADLTSQLGGVEGRLNAISAEDGAKVAAERAAAEERLVLIQEREKIYNMELNERQGGYRDEAEALKVALAEEKRAYLQESRASTNQRGALQRELEKKAEGMRRTLHELKTRQNKEKSTVTFNLEDAEARAKTAVHRRDATVETLRLTKKDIADSIEAKEFNKDIQGYIGREQQVRRTLHNQVNRTYSSPYARTCVHAHPTLIASIATATTNSNSLHLY